MPAASRPQTPQDRKGEAHRASRIVMHSPDITLKGKNQETFQNQLVENVRTRLHSLGLGWPVGAARGRVYIDTEGRDREAVARVLDAMQDMAGINSLAAATWLPPAQVRTDTDELDWPLIEDALVAVAEKVFEARRRFSVRVNRVDKTLPAHSQEMEARLGGVIRERTGWDAVDLTAPDRTFYIDAYPDGLYVYADKRRGIGGLPVGTGGRLLGLLSGGIDSPVAAFMMAKRGCQVDLFHMTAAHPDDDRMAESVVFRLAREISRFSLRSRLYAAPYTYFDLALRGRQSGYELVLFRRFLMRLAEALAQRVGAGAVITGDSLGQVASQTIENMITASQPVDIPILRPLIGMNKQEIIDQARRIGTYEISIQPYKDCCALIGRNPKTRSKPAVLERLEAETFADYDRLLADTFADMVCYEFRCGEFIEALELTELNSKKNPR